MSCFVVPAVEAAAVTAVTVVLKHKEKKRAAELKKAAGETSVEREGFSKYLAILAYLLWGGVALLIFEHVWHGEVVPWFPFLTGAASAESAAEMVEEMLTVGVTMALLTTAVWGVIVAVMKSVRKRALTESRGEKV